MKFKTKICDDSMTFQECELAILRHAVDESEEKIKSEVSHHPEIDKIIGILEDFLAKKKLVCYGGTAINNILPREAQFYDRDVEIPDYDFYSPNALEDAIELADIYHKAGYKDVEAKAGVHYGTFKVFVTFTPIADITVLPPQIFESLQKEAISVAGILYSPPDFLRMNMYLELSRPRGDVSRWEKVLKRLTALNEHYPLQSKRDCHTVDFQRKMDDLPTDNGMGVSLQEKIYLTVRDTFIDQSVVFFGGYASITYSRYMPVKERRMLQKVPDFDVLSEKPERVATIVRERLGDVGIKNVSIQRHEAIGEIIPVHYEVRVGRDILAHIYEPIACHSYNAIDIDGRKVLVGTIDTLLTFYLAFKYTNISYHNSDRIICMAKFLFDVQQENRLEQRGLLKRFSVECVGDQPTLDDMRVEKSEKFKELSGNPRSREYNMWFLKYNPSMTAKGTGAGKGTGTRKMTTKNTVAAASPKAKKRSVTRRKRRASSSTTGFSDFLAKVG